MRTMLRRRQMICLKFSISGYRHYYILKLLHVSVVALTTVYLKKTLANLGHLLVVYGYSQCKKSNRIRNDQVIRHLLKQ